MEYFHVWKKKLREIENVFKKQGKLREFGKKLN